MSATLVVLYAAPDDAATFDTHYRDVHGPLVDALPGLQSWTLAKFDGAADGGELSYYQMAQLHFADADALQAALGTAEGAAAAADYGTIAPPGSRMFIAHS